MMNSIINGNNGPFDKNTKLGKSANAGFEMAQQTKDGSIFKTSMPDIEIFQKNEEGQIDLKTGLAYVKEEMKAYDTNENGKVTSKEYVSTIAESMKKAGFSEQDAINEMTNLDKLFNVVDLNNNNILNEKENLAFIMMQDADNNGTVTSKEMEKNIDELVKDPNSFIKELKQKNEIADNLLKEKGINSSDDLDIKFASKPEDRYKSGKTPDSYKSEKTPDSYKSEGKEKYTGHKDIDNMTQDEINLEIAQQNYKQAFIDLNKAKKGTNQTTQNSSNIIDPQRAKMQEQYTEMQKMQYDFQGQQMEAYMDQMKMQQEMKMEYLSHKKADMENYNKFSDTTFGKVANNLFGGLIVTNSLMNMFGGFGGYNYDRDGANGLYGNSGFSYNSGSINMDALNNPFGYAMRSY